MATATDTTKTAQERRGQAHVRPRRARRAISGQRRGPLSRVLHDTSRLHARTPAASGVRQRLVRRRADSAQRSTSLGIAADAGRPAAGTRRLEPRRASRERSSCVHRDPEESRPPLSERHGDGSWRQANPDRGSRWQSHRVVRACPIVNASISRSVDQRVWRLSLFRSSIEGGRYDRSVHCTGVPTISVTRLSIARQTPRCLPVSAARGQPTPRMMILPLTSTCVVAPRWSFNIWLAVSQHET